MRPYTAGDEKGFGIGSSNTGEIVGSLDRPGMGSRAFRYKEGVWTELPPTGDGLSSNGSAVNDDGWVAGDRDTDTGIVAFRWRDDVVDELLSPIRGESARAADLNVHEETTGRFGSLTFGQAFLWQGDQVTIIPPLKGGTSTDGRAINDSLLLTGQSLIDVKDGSVPRRSWVFDNGKLIDLGVLSGADHQTIAHDLNDACQIVGLSNGVENNTSTPFLWQHGEILDLQSLIVNAPPDLNLSTAHAINNAGWIGVGRFVLRPVDRPLGDANIDCAVDERDLVAVLEDWGPGKQHHPTDMVTSATFQQPPDGVVDAADLAVVLGNWSTASSQSSSERSR